MTTGLADQAQALRNLMQQSDSASASAPARARVVAIASGKGGVGKSNIAVNLAVRLGMMGRRVILFDADLGAANADVLCNLTPTGSLAHVVAGRSTLAEAMVEGPGGFRLAPGASGLAEMAALGEFERNALLAQLRQLEDDADLILIDTAAGVGPNVLSFAVGADQVMVVTSPEPTAVTDAYAVMKSLKRHVDQPDIRVLVNMVRDAAEGRQVFDRLDAACRRFLGFPPRYAGHVVSDPKVPQAVRRRKPFVLDSPSCPASSCVNQLAHRMDRHAAEPRGEGLLRRVAFWMSPI